MAHGLKWIIIGTVKLIGRYIMKSKRLYRLLTQMQGHNIGDLFTFEEKHKLMASIPWQMSREILWETVEAVS